MKREERVLCSPRERLPGEWLPTCGIIPLNWRTFLDSIQNIPFVFLPRTSAETDPTAKQWIPYIILREGGRRIACYPRQGSENRLHGRWSIGIGGHINPEDEFARKGGCFSSVLLQGLAREFREEACGLRQQGDPVFLGLINEEESPVGHVHLGAVFVLEIARPRRWTPKKELKGLLWQEIQEISRPQMRGALETWSALALDLLAATGGNPGAGR